MSDFAKYYYTFLIELIGNIKSFFSAIFLALKKALITDTADYFSSLSYAAKDFGFLGWLSLIVVSLVNITLIFFVFFRIFLFLRRYIFVRSQAVQKDVLIDEICTMKLELEQMAKEKAQILNLKLQGSDMALSSLLTKGQTQEPEKDGKEKGGESRFTKLIKIDEEYSEHPFNTKMDDEDMLSLSELVERFVNFSASQLRLYYSKDLIRRYFAGLAASKVIILEGISGTGKTSLPYAMGKFFNSDAKIVSVQPSWRDRAELLGYLNEFTKKFNESDFLACLYETTFRDDPNFIIIDEMNLARIEYYFAEFLSIMEMPDTTEWKIEIVPSSQPLDPRNFHSGKILVPQNVWFVGTANQDDSTFTITDKVYDRAIAIELNNKCDYFDAPLTQGVHLSSDYLESLFLQGIAQNPVSDKLQASLKTIDDFLQTKLHVAFGNRIQRQMNNFVPVFVAAGGTENEAFDFILQSKVLRKLGALNLPFLTKQLNELITLLEKLFGKNELKLSIEYIKRLLKTI